MDEPVRGHGVLDFRAFIRQDSAEDQVRSGERQPAVVGGEGGVTPRQQVGENQWSRGAMKILRTFEPTVDPFPHAVSLDVGARR